MFCVQCGKKNPDGARYCSACGTLVAVAAEPAPPSSISNPGFDAAVAADRMPQQGSPGAKVCPSCGLFNPATASRCDCGVSFVVGTPPTVSHRTVSHRYAGFWIRVAASVIDSFVIAGLAVGGAVVFAVAGAATDASEELAVIGYYIVSLFASWLYYAAMESSERQATLGKRAVGIAVIDTDGRRLSFGRATGRAFAKWLNAVTLGIGWLVVALSRQKRGLHDFVAGTLVVQREPTPKVGGVTMGVLCALAAVPVIGIIAAIAVPGLLGARMSGNEASAIGTLRTINRAQEEYAARCRGFASALPSLRVAAKMISSDVTAAETVTRSGYEFTLYPASGAQRVPHATMGCEGAVTQYVVQAVPVSPGTTGIRFFATDAAGVVYQDKSAKFDSATPLQ
jgi:uncharacterized RDD family membrane protein YckC